MKTDNKHGSVDEPAQRGRLSSSTIYEIISHEGREELNRPPQSLAWSGLAAGICISFSLFGEGFLKLHLSDNNFLIEKLGYTVGFLIVILGRFQLFTENTITVILPLLEKWSNFKFQRTMKLWAVVLFFNLVGTFVVALFCISLPFFNIEQMNIFIEISLHAVDRNLWHVFIQAIPAGFLMAALVWMLPSAREESQFLVILLITYLIAIGDFAHVIAGSMEAFLLMLGQQVSLWQGAGFLAAACAGNIIGGSGLFALMAYAQVQKEVHT